MIRAPKFESAKQISGIEDISLVLAVLLLAVTAVCVLFGTLYPLVHEALGKGSLSVGAPYFNSIFAPMAILAALMIGAVQLKNHRCGHGVRLSFCPLSPLFIAVSLRK